jgi:hypothetical protein
MMGQEGQPERVFSRQIGPDTAPNRCVIIYFLKGVPLYEVFWGRTECR